MKRICHPRPACGPINFTTRSRGVRGDAKNTAPSRLRVNFVMEAGING